MKTALTLAALFVLAAPAFADDGLPPPRYDIGGETVAEVEANYTAMFGEQLPVFEVPYGSAFAMCDQIQMARYHLPYPVSAVGPGEILLGCLIRNIDNTSPAVVITTDSWDASLGARLLRHELGHLMGWANNHARGN